MVVEVTFKLDLKKLYHDNEDSYMMRNMSYDDMIVELKNMFGQNLERLNKDAYICYTHDWVDLFNY